MRWTSLSNSTFSDTGGAIAPPTNHSRQGQKNVRWSLTLPHLPRATLPTGRKD